MANKINIGSGVTGKIKLNGGVIFFGVPEEGDKFIITCTSAALNTDNPEPDSLRLYLEDIYYVVNDSDLQDFDSATYTTQNSVAEFLYDQFNANVSFKAIYNISRSDNIITITKKTNTHFIGECKLVIQNSIASSSITFTQTIYPQPYLDPDKYIKFILSIDNILLSKSYVSSAMGIDIPPTTITNGFKTLFDAHPTLSNNYTMIRDEATLIITNKNSWVAGPVLSLEKDFLHSSLTYKYTGTLNSLRDTSATFKIYPSNPAFDHYDVYVSFTPPNPVPPGSGWAYTKIYEAFQNHDDWDSYINNGSLSILENTVQGATISFTLYWHPAGDMFYENGTVTGSNWSLDNKTTWLLLYNYTGYTINNDFISYAGPEFTYEEQLIRGWVG